MPADDEEIVGVHAVWEAVRAGEVLHRIVIGKHRERDPKLAGLIDAARLRDIPVIFEQIRDPRLRSGDHHQHVRGLVRPFRYTPWEEVRRGVRGVASTLVVVIDHIEDPQNLGAVLRNAEGAGAGAIVMPERRNAGVTPVTRRTAAGAASHLKIARVPNIVAAIKALKDDGCWVTGLSPSQAAVPYDQADYTAKCALVVGAEGKGLSRLVMERCDALVRIPLRGQVASLNAASAAAVVLFEVARRRSAVTSV
ncbi:MAG: 23S rRNA (guanosine(2251)-2'-O)-methyltransferase RlmB [Candidatus Eremiobacteraeota bacterium]|nr:23S rRNA (guanosine(2251)-2'-O)-methyltransferase RlmB [Candidatus Eremiobacteraeota bacterium]